MARAFSIGRVVVFCATALVVAAALLYAPSIKKNFSAAKTPTPVSADPEQETTSQAVSADNCLVGTLQLVRASAKQRVTDCSKALQSHKLTASEVAVARINRGVARMEMGDKSMASVDYQEALKYYDNVIDPEAPDAMALYRRGVALDALGHTDRALSDYNAATQPGSKVGDHGLRARRDGDWLYHSLSAVIALQQPHHRPGIYCLGNSVSADLEVLSAFFSISGA